MKRNFLCRAEQIKMLQALACIEPGMIKMIVSRNIKAEMKDEARILTWARALLELVTISIDDVKATMN